MADLDLTSLFNKLDRIADLDLSQALDKAGLVVENHARELCPVETGTLRRSITHHTQAAKCTVYTDESYASYVEYGTGLFSSQGNGRQTPWSYRDAAGNWHTTIGHKPQPFMRPALQQNVTEVEQVFVKELERQLGEL